MYYLSELLINELKHIEKSKKLYQERLKSVSAYQKYWLKKRVVRNHEYYYCGKRGEPGSKYLGTIQNEKVLKIKVAHHAEKALKLIDENIALLEKVIEKYNDISFDAVQGSLHGAYQIKREAIAAENNAKALQWAERMESEKARYPVKSPEWLRHRISDGTLVRSKSEVIIAEMLISMGFIFVYELPIMINGTLLRPDFTVYIPELDLIVIIEHYGRLDDTAYCEIMGKKIGLLIPAGYMPGENLILSFEDNEGNLNTTTLVEALSKLDQLRRAAA